MTDNNESFSPAAQLNFVCSLIPSFSGDRLEFNNFVSGCDNAFAFADKSLHRALLFYIISRMDASVKSRFQGKTFETWESLKETLNIYYQDRKHYVQLMEDLNNLKQLSKESVLAYYSKIDALQNRILSTIGSSEENKGKIELIKDLALNRFVHHSNPEISRFLRCQNLTDISDALSKAMDEEKALKMSTCVSDKFNSFCNFCQMKGHEIQNCRKLQKLNQNINMNIPSNANLNRNFHPSFQNQNNFPTPQFSQNLNTFPQNQTFNSQCPAQPSQAMQQNNHNQFNNNSHNSHFDPSKTPANNKLTPSKFCSYCKKQGHVIAECRKREYNNKKRAEFQSQNQPIRNFSTGEALNFNNPSVSVSQGGHM